MVLVLSSWLAMEIEFFLQFLPIFQLDWVVSLSRSESFRLKTKSLFLLDRCALKIAKRAGPYEFFCELKEDGY